MIAVGLLGLYLSLLAIVVYFQNPKKHTNLSLIISLFVVLGWLTSVLGLRSTLAGNVYYSRLIFVLALVSIFSLAWFVKELLLDLNIRFMSEKLWKKMVYLVSIGGILGLLTPLIVKGVSLHSSDLPIPTYGKGILIYFMSLAVIVILIGRGLVKGYYYTQGVAHSQIKTIAITIILSITSAFTTNLIVPEIAGNTNTALLNPIAVYILATGLSYSIVRHRFLDFKAYLIRAAVYTMVTSLVVISYIAPLILLIMYFLDIDFTLPKFFVALALGTIAATNYNRLRQSFDIATSRIFFRDAYDPTRLIARLNQMLVSTIDLKKLLTSTSELIEAHIRPDHCAFLLTGAKKGFPRIVSNEKWIEPIELVQIYQDVNQKGKNIIITSQLPDEHTELKRVLEKNNIALVAELVTTQGSKNETLGFMLLGPRKSGKSYDFNDAEVLNAVANTLVIAMQNALHYEEIQQFNVTLQGKVEEATRKLRVSNEKLKKLDETKDEFVSMASHQLRTPLTSVKGYLSMVLEGDAGPLNPQQEQLLTQSFQSSQRMVNLIADLLNLSRLNTGKFVIDAQPTDLRVIVDQEVSQLRETAKAKNIALEWTMPQTFSLLSLDEGKIHQVVMNFIDNAIYYTPEGGNIDIVLEETPKTVELRVKDSGIGVPRDMQHKLFGKFYRADNARRMRPDGTGLGLYMAKKVVVAQGGSIIFESTENKGSTFGFCFRKSDAGGRKHSLPA